MTDHDPAREALESERAELLAMAGRIEARIAEASKRYGHKRAAVRYVEAPIVVTALRRLAAQDQEPVGYIWRYFDHPWAYQPKRPPFADDEDIECEPLYLSTPPAAGWDEEAVAKALHAVDCAEADRAHALDKLPTIDKWADPWSPSGKHLLNALMRRATVFLESIRATPAATKSDDAVGGVREESDTERQAFQKWFEADALPLEHSNWFRRDDEGYYEIDHVDWCWCGWEARALAHQPAPVAANASAEQTITENPDGSVSLDAYAGWSREQLKDRCRELVANASAEARLRDDITDWFGQIADLSTALRQGGPDPMDLQDLSGNLERACEIAGEALEALSAHPHASDCDKQGWLAKDVEDATKRVAEWRNETTKSEGGVEGHARSTKADSARGKAGSAPSQDGSLAQLAAGIESGPSDRTADVTWGELHAFILKHSDEWEDEGVAARALLDAYGMWRR